MAIGTSNNGVGALQMAAVQIAHCAISFLLTLIACVSSAHAQYRFDTWTTDDGLPHNLVNSILQTHDGYLWLGTPDGLVRYDGVRFSVFNTANTPVLGSNRITNLFEDRYGDLWIGTEDAGLMRYSEGAFANYGIADGLSGLGVRGIVADSDGKLLVLAGYDLLQLQNRSVTMITRDTASEGGLSAKGAVGLFWRGGSEQLRVLTSKGSTTYHLPKGLPTSDISLLFEDKSGNLWIGTQRSTLLRLNGSSTQIFTTKDGLINSGRRALLEY